MRRKEMEIELVDDLQKSIDEAFIIFRKKIEDAEQIRGYKKIMQTNPYFKRPFIRRWIKKIGSLSTKDGQKNEKTT